MLFRSSDTLFSTIKMFQGWIPQSIIDKALSGAQFDYIANIRARAKELSSVGQLHNTSIGSCEEL